MYTKEEIDRILNKSAYFMSKLEEDISIEDELELLKKAFSYDIGDDSLKLNCLRIIRKKYYLEGQKQGMKAKEDEIKDLLYNKHIGLI